MHKSLKKYLFVSMVSLLALTACGHKQPQGKVAMQAAHYLNPDVNGNPSPLVVNIYQLKAPYNFKQASYTQLSENAAKVLANDLIDKQTVEIRPGRSKEVTLTLANETNYIGVVADYRNIDNARWHKVVKVKKGEDVTVDLSLQSQGVNLKVR